MNRTGYVVLFFAAAFAGGSMGCTNVVNTGRVDPSLLSQDASSDRAATAEALCTSTGGVVETRTCCDTTPDFATMCWNATCAQCQVGMPMPMSRQARVCVCPVGKCYSQTLLGGGCTDWVMGTPDGGSRDSAASN